LFAVHPSLECPSQVRCSASYVSLGSGILTAPPEAWPISNEVAGVKLPDSKLAPDAKDFTRGLLFSSPINTSAICASYR
jgi:hypothetical protein